MEKKKLSLKKDVIETLSSEELEQVQGGENAMPGGYTTQSVCCFIEKNKNDQLTTSGWCCEKHE